MTALLISIIGGVPLAVLVWGVWDALHRPLVEEVHPYNWEEDNAL